MRQPKNNDPTALPEGGDKGAPPGERYSAWGEDGL